MHPLLIWLTAAVLGLAAATLSGMLGIGAAIVTLLLATPLILRGDRLAALSGLLVGFGGLWLLGIRAQAATGGSPTGMEVWLAVGAVPLAIGLLALTVRLGRTFRASRDIQRR